MRRSRLLSFQTLKPLRHDEKLSVRPSSGRVLSQSGRRWDPILPARYLQLARQCLWLRTAKSSAHLTEVREQVRLSVVKGSGVVALSSLSLRGLASGPKKPVAGIFAFVRRCPHVLSISPSLLVSGASASDCFAIFAHPVL